MSLHDVVEEHFGDGGPAPWADEPDGYEVEPGQAANPQEAAAAELRNFVDEYTGHGAGAHDEGDFAEYDGDAEDGLTLAQIRGLDDEQRAEFIAQLPEDQLAQLAQDVGYTEPSALETWGRMSEAERYHWAATADPAALAELQRLHAQEQVDRRAQAETARSAAQWDAIEQSRAARAERAQAEQQQALAEGQRYAMQRLAEHAKDVGLDPSRDLTPVYGLANQVLESAAAEGHSVTPELAEEALRVAVEHEHYEAVFRPIIDGLGRRR